LTAFEKIRKTPIPLAYSVHLTHLTWIYTLAIPFQIVSTFEWNSIPIVGTAAFAFLGILEIGMEIEVLLI
jgi:putative membrane protein